MRLLFDIETNGLLPDVSEIHCIVALDLDTGDVLDYRPSDIAAGLDLLAKADELWGHNIVGYDLPVLEHITGWTPGSVVRIQDTLLLSRLIYPDIKKDDFRLIMRKPERLPKHLIGRHSLEAWGHRLNIEKGTFGKSTDWKEFSEEMLEYCIQDCKVNEKLAKLLASKTPSSESSRLEHEFARLITHQELNGVGFDVGAARKLHADLLAEAGKLEDQLKEAFPPRVIEMKTPAYWEDPEGGRHVTKGAGKEAGWKPSELTRGPNRTKEVEFNPGSREELADRLKERYGWRPIEMTDTGKPKVSEAVLNQLPYEEAKLACRYLLIEKRLGQVADGQQAWLKLEKGGKIHGRVITNGAVTGRCTHRSPNMAQVPAVRAAFGERCRSLFGPTRPGWKFIGCDASGLELRCLAHYMSRWDGGSYANEILGGDIHTANQTAAELPTRDNAKTFIYGYCYGAGDAKLGQIVGGSAKDGARLRKKFETKLPAMGKLQKAVKKAVKDRGYLKGLDGRLLPIRSQHAALNTLLQSAGALIMKQALIEFEAKMTSSGFVLGEDYALCLNVHDEFQLECQKYIAPQVAKIAEESIAAAGVYWDFQCPLAGEAKIGNNWAETH